MGSALDCRCEEYIDLMQCKCFHEPHLEECDCTSEPEGKYWCECPFADE